MQRRALLSLSLFTALGSLTAGCNDLGDCDDPARGRTTVRVGNQIMYTGQAIAQLSCATGCHNSTVKGGGRQGAPAGLDFNLAPIQPGAPLMSNDGKVIGVSIDPAELAGLRARQRKVFDEREGIWEQVDKGLMPPGDIGKAFKNLMRVVGFTFDPVAKSCTDGTALTTLDSSKEELRNWLACGTPIVETTSADLPFAAPAGDAGVPETAAGAYAYAGQAGYQFPACPGEASTGDAGTGDAGTGPSFAAVWAIFQELDNSCTACHGSRGAMGNFSLGDTPDTAYTKLLGADGTGGMTTCAAKPKYVVPGDPASSYLLTMVDDKATGRCTASVMPPGSDGLTDAELKTITDWIMAGAKR